MERIFISYVRENAKEVERLRRDLARMHVEVWYDRMQIQPGALWTEAIRRAIQEGTHFLACFSKEYEARSRSYMNEELTLAIEELRRQPSGRNWFIPVLLSPCDIPDIEVGAGNSLRDVQYIALYEDWASGIEQIAAVVRSQNEAARGGEGRLLNVELAIDLPYDKFTSEEEQTIVGRLAELLVETPAIRIIQKKPGSVKLTVELSYEQAEQLLWLEKRGVLKELRIDSATVIGDRVAAAILRWKAEEQSYDVFMCHNSNDKQQVKRIAIRLRKYGLLPWLDEWELRPGLPWQRALEDQIQAIRSAAVFVGDSGTGPWQDMELDAFLRQFVARRCPVIPVVLRGCVDTPALPPFLNGMTWVDFRRRKPNPVHHLVWGITGERVSAD